MGKQKKYGALSGVFTPSLLTILGVIMYLRLPWIAGQAGLWSTIGIIFVAHIISITTSLSVSSIATDKKVESGGSYYIISRTMGLPIGGTLGLALFVGLSFSISLYLIGFAEIFLEYFNFDNSLTNIQIVGAGALLLLSLLTFLSTSLALKSQYIILSVVILSLLSVFLGNHDFKPLNAPQLDPSADALPWIVLFAVFFPAVTGFEAGVSMSGDLKNPRKSIPLGTISAVITGLIVYIGLAVFFTYTVDRELLAGDPAILFKISWIPELLAAGIMGATLSSALGSILGAPRILQATAIDKITPSFLAKGFGMTGEPRNALLFTFLIALSGILIGELNAIARIVTTFFIITYGFLNITYTVERWAGSDFRPDFKIPGIISIIGAIACIVVMIQLDIVALIGASLILTGVFLFLKRRELTLQTGDTWNSVWASLVKTGLRKLSLKESHPRNWRPNVILFSGGYKHRPHLIEMAKAIAGKLGIFTNFELIESKDEKKLFSKHQQVIGAEDQSGKDVVTRRHHCKSIYQGIEDVAKIYGVTGFVPNTVLLGWPRNTNNPDDFLNSYKILKKLDYNIVFLNYDKTFEYGNKKLIDIWWSGKGRNLNFAITLVRFINSSEVWRAAKVRILAVNPHNGLTAKYYELLSQVVDDNRIDAEIKVINNSIEQLPEQEIIKTESLHTDLSLLEFDDSQEHFYEFTNNLVEHAGTCLLIRSSTQFEDFSLEKTQTDDSLTPDEAVDKPTFTMPADFKYAQKEIIASRVNSTAEVLLEVTHRYYKNSFGKMMEKFMFYSNELAPLVEKVSDQMYNILRGEKQDIGADTLRILNDYTYSCQRILKNFRQELLIFEKQNLERSTEIYLSELSGVVQELPQFIRIRYHWKEFSRLKPDSFKAFLYKYIQILKSRITRRQAVYKIKTERIAKYYLLHKRLEVQKQVLNSFYNHSFSNVIDVRKILDGVEEVLQKCKAGTKERDKMKNIVLMEKDRFKASAELLEEKNRNFYYKTGKIIETELLKDLQSFSNLLDRPGANFFSKTFVRSFKDDAQTDQYVRGFADQWYNNVHLLVNKIFLDYLLHSLKNRIESKVYKTNFELYGVFKSGLINPLDDLKSQINDYLDHKPDIKKYDVKRIKSFNIESYYQTLFDDISSLFSGIPLILSISGDELLQQMQNKEMEEAQEIIISVRKTVEFTIASELIDYAKKQATENSIMLEKTVHHINDLVRLINFNFFVENETDLSEEDKKQLAYDFIRQIEKEQTVLQNIYNTMQKAFNTGIKNAFAPLSASIISKTAGTISKKIRETESRKMMNFLKQGQKKTQEFFRNQFVNVVYSRSESVLWLGKHQSRDKEMELTNQEVYSYLESISPGQGTREKLPFFYTKLFSGQSATGEDFWVGMEEEIHNLENSIRRFRWKQGGCIIVTGKRNSGKTALSKFVTKRFFDNNRIYNIRAPRHCTADVEIFRRTIQRSLGQGEEPIEKTFDMIDSPVVLIINDLELWWERREGGSEVINQLTEWIRGYGKKVLFLLNLNIHALNLINQLTQISSWSIGTVVCEGLDARQIKEMIMLRHQAGGMSFILDRKHETEMNAWRYARLFNRYFDVTKGNPGFAINLWIASIKKVSGKTIYTQKPPALDTSFLSKLSKEQIYFLLQFVYHLRLSADDLSRITLEDKGIITNKIFNLWHSGILSEKFPGVYAINTLLHIPLIEKMKEMNILE